MPMNGNQLAAEMLRAMGGKVTPQRLKAFQRMADAIVKHIQANLVVASSGVDPQGGTVTSTSTLVQ